MSTFDKGLRWCIGKKYVIKLHKSTMTLPAGTYDIFNLKIVMEMKFSTLLQITVIFPQAVSVINMTNLLS